MLSLTDVFMREHKPDELEFHRFRCEFCQKLPVMGAMNRRNPEHSRISARFNDCHGLIGVTGCMVDGRGAVYQFLLF